MITGTDYIFKTKKNAYFFFHDFEVKLRSVWNSFFKEHDFEEGITSVFYSKDTAMFNLLEEEGYNLNENGEGCFLVMFNERFLKKENRITLVSPCDTNKSMFCQKIYNAIKDSVDN